MSVLLWREGMCLIKFSVHVEVTASRGMDLLPTVEDVRCLNFFSSINVKQEQRQQRTRAYAFDRVHGCPRFAVYCGRSNVAVFIVERIRAFEMSMLRGRRGVENIYNM